MAILRRFSLYTIKVPFIVDFYTAKSRVGTRDKPSLWTLIRTETDEGLISTTGIAEQPQWIGPTQAAVFSDMNYEICPALIGANSWHLPEIRRIIDSRVKILNHHHRCLIEQVALDINAKEAGVPAFKLLGGEKKSIDILWTVGAPAPEYMSQQAKAKAKEGYKRFKIKSNALEPLLTMQKIEAVIAGIAEAGYLEEVDFTLDWNESFGYDAHQAVTLIRQVEEAFTKAGADLAYMEQPLREDVALEATAWIQGRVGTNIMLDESVRTPKDIAHLANKGLHLGLLKPEKMGGPYTIAGEVLPLAKTLGVSMYGGAFTNEPTGTMAAAHTYSRCEVSGPMELNGPHMMSEDFLDCFEGWPGCGPSLEVSECPGIGVEADVDKLQEKDYIAKTCVVE